MFPALAIGRNLVAGVAHAGSVWQGWRTIPFRWTEIWVLLTRDEVAKRRDGMRLSSCTLAGAGNGDVRLQAV
jgi:hypothetical protein